MSILSRIVRRRPSKFFAPLSPRIRENRRPRDPHPFGEGLFTRSWSIGLTEFQLIEDDDAPARDGSPRYTLYVVADGHVLEAYGVDTVTQAETLARHIAHPLPPEASFDEFLAYEDETAAIARGMLVAPVVADEPPSPEAAFEPSPADSLWWAQHSHEGESSLDAWLDTAAPADYATHAQHFDPDRNGQFGMSTEGGDLC